MKNQNPTQLQTDFIKKSLSDLERKPEQTRVHLVAVMVSSYIIQRGTGTLYVEDEVIINSIRTVDRILQLCTEVKED